MCYTKTIGDIIVAKKLENLPKEWDVKHNEKWNVIFLIVIIILIKMD
jgi:hypothetical protein